MVKDSTEVFSRNEQTPWKGGPWASFTNAAIYGDDVDGAFANAQAEMQSIIDNAK